jgi:pimeloyl-ACP methyl ester carboxylesterase
MSRITHTSIAERNDEPHPRQAPIPARAAQDSQQASQQSAHQEADASFGPVRQIDAGVLNVGYVEAGPADGRPVLLLHGFPYDIHSYVEVAPLLAAEGYRVIVPYFRGYGTTTFLSPDTPRNVDQAAFALDILALMDALGIRRAILAGYDWGSRTADIIAALWPERVKALVSVTGYLITNLAANLKPLPPQSENAWWYQYYFSTERGVQGLKQYTSEFTEFVWRFNSPHWNFSADTLARTVAAFSNADFVPIVIGNYRWRLSLAPANRSTPKSRPSCSKPQASACPRSPSTEHRTRSRRPGTGQPTARGSPEHTTIASSRSDTTCRRRTRAASPAPSWTPTGSDGVASCW